MSLVRLTPMAAVLSLVMAAPAALAQALPDGPGKELVQKACQQCHGTDIFAAQGHSRDEWTDIVAQMIGRGLQVNDDEYAQVIDYLSTRLPDQKAAPEQKAPDMPAGGSTPSGKAGK